MKERFIKIVRRHGDSLAINIPIEIAKLLNIKDGDIVRIQLEKVKRK